MTPTEQNIYEVQLALQAKLEEIKPIDIIVSIEKEDLTHRDSDTALYNIDMLRLDTEGIEVYFDGTALFDHISHTERDWLDQEGYGTVTLIDEVYDSVEAFSGRLIAKLGEHERELWIEDGEL